jgi:hypothetical protein
MPESRFDLGYLLYDVKLRRLPSSSGPDASN